MRARTFTLLLSGLLSLTPVAASTQQHRAAPSFTLKQAERGGQFFQALCAGCHGAKLEGAPSGWPLPMIGAAFLRPGRTLDDIFYILRTTMPEAAPGSLPTDAYLDLLAYILKQNGMTPGSTPLSASRATLQAVRLAEVAPAGRLPSAPPPPVITGQGSPVSDSDAPTQTELNGAAEGSEWLYHTGNYAGTRYSPLREIDRTNVGRLRVACAYQLGGGESFQSGPLVYRGTMYLTTATVTVAIDATTCRERWRYTWARRDLYVWPNNRGVAIKGHYLVRGTDDGYLVALDRETGTLRWARQVASPADGETITMAPLVFEDLVVIGPAGSEHGIKGWIGAFRLADGEPVWRFHTVPRPGEPGAETWANPAGVPMGGGSVWTAPSLDVERGELYVAVTNPAPDLPAGVRPGKNLYTNSLVALDVRTGKLRWYDQMVPNDFHDWDLTQSSPLFRARIQGRDRRLVVASGKDGKLRILDRESHERLSETPVTTLLNTDAPMGKDWTRFCPGFWGGVEWNGPAYHPDLGLLFVPSVDWCMRARLADTVRKVPGVMYIGGDVQIDSAGSGWVTAIDQVDGKVRWRYHSPKPMLAAVTATAGNLLFTGELTGDFLALDATDGRELYRFHTGGPLGGGVVSYAVEGKQYLAAASGHASFLLSEMGGAPTLFVFTLAP